MNKKEKCFICNKESYLSNRYIREKYKDSKNKFKEQFFWKFNKLISQYIAKYEKVDYEKNNDLKSNDDIVKVLMIDIEFLLPFLLDQENINIDNFITFLK